MPVLVTTTAITLLLNRGSGRGGAFLNPPSLREHLEKLPDSETRAQALAIADDLETIGREYTEAASASLEAYEAHAEQWDASADSLIADMAPLDAALAAVLADVIRVRESLLDTLSPEEWGKVFG